MPAAHDRDRLRPDFLALPLDRLCDVALQRCRDFGVEHADVRIELLTDQSLRLRDGAVETSHDGQTLGLGVRVVLDGSLGVRRHQQARHRRRRADRGERGSRRAGVGTAGGGAGAAGRRARSRRRGLGVGLPAGPVRGTGRRQGRPVRRVERRPAAQSGRTPRRPDVLARGREQALRRPRRHDDHPAARTHAPGRDGARRRRAARRDRLHAHCRAAGRARLGVPHRPRLRVGLGRGARRAARPAGGQARRAVGRRRPLRPGRRPVEPLAHHPRVRRPCHRARPGAGLRGQLRRHQLRHVGPARRAAVRVAGDDRHRRPHHRPRAVDHRLRRRGRPGAELGHRA